MKKQKLDIGLVLALALATVPAGSALADTTPGTSAASASQTTGGIMSKLEGSYFGIFSGPSLANPGIYQIDPTSPGTDASPDSPQGLANQLKVNYKINDNIFVGPVVNFTTLLGTTTKHGYWAYMNDSGVRIGDKHIVKTANFNLAGDFRVMAPIDPGKVNEMVGFQSLQSASYDIPNTKWTLAILGFDTVSAYQTGGHGTDLDFYLGPNISYQVTKPLALTLWVDLELKHSVAANDYGIQNFLGVPMDIAPGVSWDILPNLNVSPQIVFYPMNLAAIGTTVYISAKFF